MSVRFKHGNYSKLFLECCNMAILAVQFSEILGRSISPDPIEKLACLAVTLFGTKRKKNPQAVIPVADWKYEASFLSWGLI